MGFLDFVLGLCPYLNNLYFGEVDFVDNQHFFTGILDVASGIWVYLDTSTLSIFFCLSNTHTHIY